MRSLPYSYYGHPNFPQPKYSIVDSLSSMSFENLLSILPAGVESKKAMGERRTEESISSCMREEPVRNLKLRVILAMRSLDFGTQSLSNDQVRNLIYQIF